MRSSSAACLACLSAGVVAVLEDRIDPPLGPGVDPHIRYSWIITCLQVGMDLVSGGEPPEVGHNYIGASGAAIALTINPPGWTAEKTVAMQESLAKYRYVTG